MRLVLADDHALFRDGLRNLLEAHGLEVVAEAANGHDAIRMVRRHQPDVVLMDIQMPVLNGLDATRLLSAELPAIRIVMLTASSDDADIFEAIKSGASGYLSKDLEADRFISLLEGVMRGEPALSPAVARKVLGELAKPQATTPETPGTTLTEREREVPPAEHSGQAPSLQPGPGDCLCHAAPAGGSRLQLLSLIPPFWVVPSYPLAP